MDSNEEGIRNWKEFKQGLRCKNCTNTEKKLKICEVSTSQLDDIKKEVSSRGCIYISSEYKIMGKESKRNQLYVKYNCICGEEYEKYFVDFKKNPSCKSCAYKNRKK